MFKRLAVIVGAVFLLVTIALADTLQTEAIKSAERYTYVREKTGKNDAPEIDLWLKYLGLPLGSPYCAAFALYNYHIAADKLKIQMPLPKIGRVSLLYKACQKNPYKYKTLSAKRVFLGIEKLEPGDLPAWAHGSAEGNFNGHTGIVLLQKDSETFNSIEGNTGPGAAGSQREGNGVFKRTRKLDIGKNFQVVGFIRVK
jgi:hypothetical protein